MLSLEVSRRHSSHPASSTNKAATIMLNAYSELVSSRNDEADNHHQIRF
jgi:hypothetical protein